MNENHTQPLGELMKIRVWCEPCDLQFLVNPPSEQMQKTGWFFVCEKCYESGRGFAAQLPLAPDPLRSANSSESDEHARGVMVDRPFFSTLVHTAAGVERTLEAAAVIWQMERKL